MILRIRIVFICFLVVTLALLTRLFYWQVIKGKGLSDEAKKQHQVNQVLSAPRGNILASDGSYFAARSEGWLVYASIPELSKNTNRTADLLAPFLGDAGPLKELLTKKGLVWVPLKHKVNAEVKNNLEAMAIPGIGFDPEEIRQYPEGSSAAQLLGFVGKNEQGADQGYFGLEGYYNMALSGKQGYLSRDSDVRGNPIGIGDSKEIGAVSGINLLTHIEKGIQITVDEKLKQGIEKYGALSGTVTILEPKSGAIIAMSSYPNYDPATYSQFSNDLFKNPIVSDSFEPGSVFKVLVMAAALDANVIQPDTQCDICDGPVSLDKYSIETWNNKYHPNSTMTDVIVNSDNVGMVFVGQKLGADKLYDYLTAFGVGSETGVDLQGESSPRIREKGKWGIVDLATTTFGQGIAVTPIQMIRAVGAIANQGIITTPQVVNKLQGDNWEETIKPIIGKRVISVKAAGEITNMMVEAAKAGESKWTYTPGFRVAGKTGTAQIPIAGHYDDKKTIASFVGFAPAEDPKFVMLVTLREPQSSQWASETAAPLWYNIAKDLFVHYSIQAQN